MRREKEVWWGFTPSKLVHLRRDITSKSPIKSGFWSFLLSDGFFRGNLNTTSLRFHTKTPWRPQTLRRPADYTLVLLCQHDFFWGEGGSTDQKVKFYRILKHPR